MLCSQCCDITQVDPCSICSDPTRDTATVWVVVGPADLRELERQHRHNGVYHVLHGLISPIDGVTLDKLTIGHLQNRVIAGGIKKVVIAIEPTTVEAKATAFYIQRLLSHYDVEVVSL